MIEVLFFARYKEALGEEKIRIDWQDSWNSLDDVRNHLVRRGEPWTVLADTTIMCARNQDMCALDTPVQKGDEIAFFPVVTGG